MFGRVDKVSDLGQRIRSARRTRNMTAAQLADQIGVSANYISELERGIKQNPSMQVIASMSEVLRYPVDYFFGTAEKRIGMYIPSDLSSYVQETIVAPYASENLQKNLADLHDHEMLDALIEYLRTMKNKEKAANDRVNG